MKYKFGEFTTFFSLSAIFFLYMYVIISEKYQMYIVQLRKISILLPQKRLQIPGGLGGSLCMKLDEKFQRGGGFPWRRCGYFLE